jgi:hypothetical protein
VSSADRRIVRVVVAGAAPPRAPDATSATGRGAAREPGDESVAGDVRTVTVSRRSPRLRRSPNGSPANASSAC